MRRFTLCISEACIVGLERRRRPAIWTARRAGRFSDDAQVDSERAHGIRGCAPFLGCGLSVRVWVRVCGGGGPHGLLPGAQKLAYLLIPEAEGRRLLLGSFGRIRPPPFLGKFAMRKGRGFGPD